MIGCPSLASSSAEQGRIARAHASGDRRHTVERLLPIGIYSIPEISYVGKTEAELTAASIPYESASRTTASSRAARSSATSTAW